MSYFEEEIHGFGVMLDKTFLNSDLIEALSENAGELPVQKDNPTIAVVTDTGLVYCIPDAPLVENPDDPIDPVFTTRIGLGQAIVHITNRILHDIDLVTETEKFSPKGFSRGDFIATLLNSVDANAERCPGDTRWVISG